MPRIIYIKESKTKGYLILGIKKGEEKCAFYITRALYSSLGSPTLGYELDEGEISALEECNEEYRALRKALSLLSYADNSERSLKMKLLRAGYSRTASEAAVKEVVRLGYLKEEDQLERLILSEANSRLTGPQKLIPKLVSKGYSASDVRRVLDRLVDEGEVDFDENRRRLFEKKLTDDATDEEKFKLLKSYGYRTYD